MMAIYEESGLRLELPDGEHFRFADLPAYQALCGQHLKEMDFAWIIEPHLVLLEVRDYRRLVETLAGDDFLPRRRAEPPRRFQALIDKVTDTLLMLLAAWAGTASGQALRRQLPEAARHPKPLHLIVAIELPATLTTHLGPLRDALNQQLRGRIALADVSRVTLLDYDRLVTHPLFSPYLRKIL
jgi:hypothetical protein